MWMHSNARPAAGARAIRIVLALVLVLSVAALFLHVHEAESDHAPCPQCILLAGLVLPLVLLIYSAPAAMPALPRVVPLVAPLALHAWSRRLRRGPPSTH
jgi:hypothetical protein